MSNPLKNMFIDIGDDHYYMIQRFKSPVDISLFREIKVHTYINIFSKEQIDQIKKKLERIKIVESFAKHKQMEGYYIFVDEKK